MLKPDAGTREKDKGDYPVDRQSFADNKRIKFKVRFDYRGKPKPARFFFGGRKTEDVAQEIREQQVTLWRNLPLQGIFVEGIDLGEIYNLYDEELDDEVAFAPLELIVYADTLEDLLRFIMREEFRRIEIMEPPSLVLNCRDVEKLLFRISEIMQKRFFTKGKVN
ncbi:MAG: hypothetical protein AB1796_14285 [Bacillota bacterium]